MSELRAAGGLCVPVRLFREPDDIMPNYIAPAWRNRTLKGRLRNFFAWSEGWGFPLEGYGPPIRLRDMLPKFTATRGVIRFIKVPSDV